MPGPQGPETIKPLTDKTDPVGKKADTPATEIGDKEPPKTSLVDNSTSNSAVTTGANNTSGANNTNGSTTTKTTTTSNQAPRVVGFRYYRDLGQK